MIFLLFLSCSSKPLKNPYVIVLGTTQDGGAPHAGCNKKCCVKRWSNSKKEFLMLKNWPKGTIKKDKDFKDVNDIKNVLC